MVVYRLDPARQREEAFDGRASAIARGSRQALEVLGLWAGMAPAAAPILDIRISDGRAYETGLGSRRPGGASALHLPFPHQELSQAAAGRPARIIGREPHLPPPPLHPPPGP